MVDFLYKPEDIDKDIKPIFDQVMNEFGSSFQIWRRVEDFGRCLSIGILNPSTNIAVNVAVKSKAGIRRELLSKSELQQIHDHFKSNMKCDLDLN